MPRGGKVLLVLAAGLTFELAVVTAALAQAWVPPKGEAWFSLSYGNLYNRDHYDYVGLLFAIELLGIVQ